MGPLPGAVSDCTEDSEMRRRGLAAGWDWGMCLTLRDTHVPVAPQQPLPRPPNSLGRSGRWAGQLPFLPGLSLAAPGPAPSPPTPPLLLFRKQSRPPATSRSAAPASPSRQTSQGRRWVLPTPCADRERPAHPSPRTHGRRSRPLRGLLAEGTRLGTEGRPDGTWTPGHLLQSSKTAQPRGGQRPLPGDQSASPLPGFKLFP